jgi:hypothetical protein
MWKEIETKFLKVATMVATNANEVVAVPVVGTGGDCSWQEFGF